MPSLPGSGRKRAKIDLVELEKLAMLYCTKEEIAAWFGYTRMTLDRCEKRTPKVREIIERGYAKARISLRRQQVQAAERGNPTMLIWLGKQYLGQKDHAHFEHTGRDGAGINLNVSATELLESRIASLASRRGTGGTDPKP